MEDIKPKKERKFLKAVGKVAGILLQEFVLGLGRKFIGKKIDRIGNKRQALLIFLALFCNIAFASVDSIPYPITGNKQRLGWQTSGNGLVYRGRSQDTITKPTNYVDKNVKAYLILDSVRGTIFVWRQTYWDSLLVGGGGGGGLTMPFDSITFNTAKDGTVGVGEVEYNDTQGSLIQGLKGGNVTNVIGQQLHQRVNNRTGAPLAKGDVVYLSGSQGNRITVAKAIATSDPTSANTFGIVAESIADNASGYVITEGLITGLNTSALIQDSAVYLSGTTAGALTSTKPQAPIHGVYIGVCVKSNAGSGEIFVKIRNGQELDELHDVQITSPVNNASLYYKSSEGLWRDTTAAILVSDTASMLLPYLRDADTVTLSNRINLKLNIADTSAFARDNQISGTSGQVAYFNSSSSVVSDTALRWSAANKSLGINMTTTPSRANLIIKNSQEPVRSTFLTTQTFAADTTNWTRGTGWTFNGTVAVATAATGALTYTPALTITSGNAYEITYTVTGYTAGTLTARIGNASYALPTHNISSNIILLTPTSATGGFRFTTSTFTGNLDNVSIVEVGNPAPVLIAAQDNNSSTLYDVLRVPNELTISIVGGGAYTTALNNVFLGENAGNANTTGQSNNFFGAGAGQLNTSGQANNFFGLGAGNTNTIGQSNNFFGTRAGISNTSGGANNFFGADAGYSNTTASSNNFFGSQAGYFTTTGGSNNFFGNGAGRSNISGTNNNFFGYSAGYINSTGERNNFFGFYAGYENRTGIDNIFLGTNSGRSNRTGLNNIAIGNTALHNTSVADSLTGSNNIAFGTNAADNIRAAASGNVVIGNQVDLPTNNGSNQGVYQNVLFFTGASTGGTTIAAGSRAGIKTNAPNRDFEVAGEVRITDLTTDTPTRLVGADADGDLGQVTLGAGLSLASSSLLADTNFLVTRFDTASMLTNYLRTGVAASTYLTQSNAASTYLTQSNAASTYLPLTGGTLTGTINRQEGNHDGSASTFYYNILNYFAKRDNNKGNQTAQITFTDRPGTATFENNVRTSDIYLMTAKNFSGGQLGQYLDTTLSVVANQDGGRVGISKLNPSYKLDVNGTFNASGNSLIGGTLGVTGATTLSSPLTVNSSAVFNEGSADADFRVESDGNANMVFVDASTDRVGIGYASPTKTLDVNGTLGVFGATTLSNTLTVDGKTILNDSSRFEGKVLFKKNMGLPIVKINNADYTATTDNHTIIYTTLTADKTLTIPNAADAVGVKFVISIFDIPEGNEALTLVTPGSNLFVRTDGENSSVDIVGGFCTTIQSDGTKWYILSYAPMY